MNFPPDFPYWDELHKAKAESDSNFAALMEQNTWLDKLPELAEAAVARGDKHEGYKKLVRLADRINQAAENWVACRPGCAQCCRISVVVTEYEAKLLAKASGKKPARVRKTGNRDDMVSKYFGVPCPFLKDERCSVYAHRPIACRTHVNLSASAFFCNTAIQPDWSFVPSLNLASFNMAYAYLLRQEVAADIRDFFPPNNP